MPRTQRTGLWVGLVCDASSATAYVVRGFGSQATLQLQQHLEFDPDALKRQGLFPELQQFVAAQQLGGLGVHAAFVGAGTVVENMQIPLLGRRNRMRAIRTRLARYLPGSELCVALHAYPSDTAQQGENVLAAGVDAALARGMLQACRRAGLRVAQFTALSVAVPPATASGLVVQLLITERTTNIQIFSAGRLVNCRGVLLGRRDFVTAFQRPVLTEAGAVSFTAQQAEELCRTVGVPFGREDEIRPGVFAMQLWPTLNPVLQKLRHEISQSLVHGQFPAADATLCAIGAPPVPGLSEFLADDLQLAGVALPTEQAETHFLAGLAGRGRSHAGLDLRPPEERFNDRLLRPALAAGLCAFFVIFGNSSGPRQAQACLAELRPLAARVESQLTQARQQRADAEQRCAQQIAEQRREAALTKALPPTVPVVDLLKYLFGTLPAHVDLLDVQFQGQTQPRSIDLHAAYQGHVAASVVAAQWAREIGAASFVATSKVGEVSGSGQQTPALLVVQCALK